MARAMIALFLACLSIAITIGASLVGMIYGWGLTPTNWGWVAFSYAATLAALGINAFISSLTKD